MAIAWKDHGATDQGRVRRINEDAFLALPDLGRAGLWVVADGMGGHRAGDLASSAIVDSLLYIPPADDFDTLVGSVVATIERVNGELHHLGQEGGREGVIGSTVVVLAVHETGRAACLWAGDSRLYRLRQGSLARLSRDHSHVQWLIDAGVIDEAQAEGHPNANVITNAVGADARVRVDRIDFEASAGDVLMLCSDGVTKELHDDEIRAVLRLADPRPVVEGLIGAALDRGGRDNMTAVCVRIDAVDQEDTTRSIPF